MAVKYSCNFEHWKWEIPEGVLKRFLSPHFSRSDAAKAVEEKLRDPHGGAQKISSNRHDIPEIAIIAGNEAYPEAAISDPISDLLVWYDWESGRRTFPYPGIYAPLGLKDQEQKSVSTSVVGVFGEILTGLYSQAGISASPLARVIGKWPDFIFERHGDSHFVEAKGAINEQVSGSPITKAGRHGTNLREILLEAIQQFGSDPWVTFWGGFVGIHIDESLQIQFTMTLLELLAPASRKATISKSIPDLVTNELAKRIISRTLASRAEFDIAWEIRKKPIRQFSLLRDEKTFDLAQREMGKLLDLEAPEFRKFGPEIKEEMTNLLKRIKPSKNKKPGRIEKLRGMKESTPIQIRQIGDKALIMIPLSDHELIESRKNWTPSWKKVEETVTRLGYNFYRAGGSLFGLVPKEKADQFPKRV